MILNESPKLQVILTPMKYIVKTLSVGQFVTTMYGYAISDRHEGSIVRAKYLL